MSNEDKTLEDEYISYEEMSKRFFTDESVETVATRGAMKAVGNLGLQWILMNAFEYGKNHDVKTYVIKFVFKTTENKGEHIVEMFDGNLDKIATFSLNGLNHRFNGEINVKENWNGNINPKIPDEHYICIYLPEED